jgi:hypothetical protein
VAAAPGEASGEVVEEPLQRMGPVRGRGTGQALALGLADEIRGPLAGEVLVEVRARHRLVAPAYETENGPAIFPRHDERPAGAGLSNDRPRSSSV